MEEELVLKQIMELLEARKKTIVELKQKTSELWHKHFKADKETRPSIFEEIHKLGTLQEEYTNWNLTNEVRKILARVEYPYELTDAFWAAYRNNKLPHRFTIANYRYYDSKKQFTDVEPDRVEILIPLEDIKSAAVILIATFTTYDCSGCCNAIEELRINDKGIYMAGDVSMTYHS